MDMFAVANRVARRVVCVHVEAHEETADCDLWMQRRSSWRQRMRGWSSNKRWKSISRNVVTAVKAYRGEVLAGWGAK